MTQVSSMSALIDRLVDKSGWATGQVPLLTKAIAGMVALVDSFVCEDPSRANKGTPPPGPDLRFWRLRMPSLPLGEVGPPRRASVTLSGKVEEFCGYTKLVLTLDPPTGGEIGLILGMQLQFNCGGEDARLSLSRMTRSVGGEVYDEVQLDAWLSWEKIIRLIFQQTDEELRTVHCETASMTCPITEATPWDVWMAMVWGRLRDAATRVYVPLDVLVFFDEVKSGESCWVAPTDPYQFLHPAGDPRPWLSTPEARHILDTYYQNSSIVTQPERLYRHLLQVEQAIREGDGKKALSYLCQSFCTAASLDKAIVAWLPSLPPIHLDKETHAAWCQEGIELLGKFYNHGAWCLKEIQRRYEIDELTTATSRSRQGALRDLQRALELFQTEVTLLPDELSSIKRLFRSLDEPRAALWRAWFDPLRTYDPQKGQPSPQRLSIAEIRAALEELRPLIERDMLTVKGKRCNALASLATALKAIADWEWSRARTTLQRIIDNATRLDATILADKVEAIQGQLPLC